MQIVRKLWRMTNHVAKEVLRIALQRFEFRVGLRVQIRLRFDARAKVRTKTDQVHNLYALQTLQEYDHISIGHLYGLVNFGQRSDFVQVCGGGILNARIKLGHHSQEFLVSHEGVYQRQGALTSNRKRQHRAWKEHRVTHRQDRKNLWNYKFFLRHVIP